MEQSKHEYMNRNAIINHVELWKSKLGSYAAVAKRVGISSATMSTILGGKYGADEHAMLQRIADKLDYRAQDWNVVRTISNYRTVAALGMDAKQESMWFAVSNRAGSGKSAALEDIFNADTTGTITLIQCEEWTGRQFLTQLVVKTLGEDALKGKYKTLSQLTELVVNQFNGMSLERPVLFIDEADKLRPAAFRSLIPIYNRTEGRLGAVLSGTENFRKELESGVRTNKKGFDELESRLGRTYIALKGITKDECAAICTANGVEQPEIQEDIWNELPKAKKLTRVRTPKGEREVEIFYAEDLRLLKRLVKRETLKRRAA